MNHLIYFLAVIGGLSVLGFVFFLIVGLVNSIIYFKKDGKEE